MMNSVAFEYAVLTTNWYRIVPEIELWRILNKKYIFRDEETFFYIQQQENANYEIVEMHKIQGNSPYWVLMWQ